MLNAMKVSAFTYVRNGLMYDYPFIEAIRSALPLVDELIAVVGDSTDGTRKAIEQIGDSKIKIVDTVWDDKMRSKGLIFAQQSNTGLLNVSKDADWLLHIQADEVLHEKDYPAIRKAMEDYLEDKRVEGFLFRFLNFFGDYNHYAPSRRYHQREIRIIRNNPSYHSYRDSQGFRRFDNLAAYPDEKGYKLHVIPIDATVYHYSYVKNPSVQLKKQVEFGKRWRENDDWIESYLARFRSGYEYNNIDYLATFQGTHPQVMQRRIMAQDWTFKYNPRHSNMRFKERLMKLLEDITGKQFFIYKNYKLLKK